MKIVERLTQRFQDLILSIYLYNEKRGYTEVERLAETLPAHGFESGFISAVRKHAADEKAHYNLFRAYFEKTGRPPYQIGSFAGYFDRAFKNIWGQWTWEVDLSAIAGNRKQFSRLCRTIFLAELRGIQQVNWVLRLPWVKKNPDIKSIFERVRKDEPSHIVPYRRYLRRWDRDIPTPWEKICDLYVHLTLSYMIVPVLFLNPGLKRQPTGMSATLTGLASAPSSLSGNATKS